MFCGYVDSILTYGSSTCCTSDLMTQIGLWLLVTLFNYFCKIQFQYGMLTEISTKFHGPMLSRFFLPINEKEKHWFLAQFEIRTGIVTFYDSVQQEKKKGSNDEQEHRPWYVNMRACLKVINNFSKNTCS